MRGLCLHGMPTAGAVVALFKELQWGITASPSTHPLHVAAFRNEFLAMAVTGRSRQRRNEGREMLSRLLKLPTEPFLLLSAGLGG